MNLEEETRKLLKLHLKTSSLTKTAQAAGVGFHWLQHFNLYPDSGSSVKTVQKLYDWLIKQGE